MDFPLLLSVFALAVASASFWTSLRSARASERSADAAKTSADAASRSADAAGRSAEAQEKALALQAAEDERTSVVLSTEFRRSDSYGVVIRITNSGHSMLELDEAVIRQIDLSFKHRFLNKQLMGGAATEFPVPAERMRVRSGDEITISWHHPDKYAEKQHWMSLL